MQPKSVRSFEGIENLEDFLEVFEAFANDLINNFASLNDSVRGLSKSVIELSAKVTEARGN
jgi:hypothetical protein